MWEDEVQEERYEPDDRPADSIPGAAFAGKVDPIKHLGTALNNIETWLNLQFMVTVGILNYMFEDGEDKISKEAMFEMFEKLSAHRKSVADWHKAMGARDDGKA